MILGIPFEFMLLALTLLGVIFFHQKSTYIAVVGALSVLCYKYLFNSNFSWSVHMFGSGVIGGSGTEHGEWKILLNLVGLLLGFSILARYFEDSKIANITIKYLPHNWKGAFFLLIIIFILSSFLDNIAAAMIGGAMAHTLFKNKVHIGYVAAIIAASNAGGAGSVLGDTTTTMMWVQGVSAMKVLHAYVGSIVAMMFFGVFAAKKQSRYQNIVLCSRSVVRAKIDFAKTFIVAQILVLTIVANYVWDFPALGVWSGILIGGFFVSTPWKEVKSALPGSIFLLSLVYSASLMPVEKLPPASWITALGLGMVSSLFDNIPLTKLCLDQGGYDWGILAYTVGYGGSMTWFGSSAGVALSNMYPEIKSLSTYLREGWYVIVAYFLGFFVMLKVVGWNIRSINFGW
ncbi:MAG: citrate transporter [Oligoflexia bacterium]|nr:citrate transporter [Oligoflexia bacterium]